MRSIIATLLVLALLLNVVACVPQNTTNPNNKGTYTAPVTPELKLEEGKFNSNEQLLAFIKSHSGGSNNYYARGGVGGEMMLTDTAIAPSAGVQKSLSVTSGSSAPTPDHSATNNQVAAVDEADIIKTDGNYIYTVTENTLFIVKAYPGEDAKVVSKITLKSRPEGLFIQDNKLAVIGNFYDADYFKTIDFVPRNGMSYLNIYDVSNKEKPKLEKELKFEGNYMQARMYNDNVYLVVQSQPNYRTDYPTPIIIDGTTIKSVAIDNIRYMPIPYNSIVYTTAHSISLKSNEVVDSEAMLTEWTQTIYMSEKNLYIASNLNINEYDIRQQVLMDVVADKLSANDNTIISKIKSADDDILSQQEKQQKILQVYNEYVQYKLNDSERQDLQDKIDKETKTRLEKYDALTYTVINRLSLEGGKITLAATGKVPGTVNNQFALDEYNGVLRIATTLRENRWWIEPRPLPAEPAAANSNTDAKIAIMPPRPRWQIDSTNNIYTLDATNAELNVLDKKEGIAPGEQIFSTRFMDERLYLVTFRQVDPFFVFDLSNPKNIKELGSLKVPGFSKYLHPYDKDTIIGIGQDATEAGRQTGLKISLFDVSDVAKPKEIAKFTASGDYSSSTAEYEHKAFLFSREKELLVIPAYSYNYNNQYGSSQSYNGAMVFHITKDEITLRGIVDHTNGQQQWSPQVERSLWISDLLYTKSPYLLRINKISDLSSVQKVILETANNGPYTIY